MSYAIRLFGALLAAVILPACGESGTDQPGAIHDPGGWGTGGSYATDSGNDSSDGSDAPADPNCLGWYQFLADNCATTDPIDPEAFCQGIETLKVNAGCEAEYETLLSCVKSHESEWVCEPAFCSAEASAVSDCVMPYCQTHPAECESP